MTSSGNSGNSVAAVAGDAMMELTNTPGVQDADGRATTRVGRGEADKLIGDGTIASGMLPKARCAMEAVAGGVGSAHVIDGRTPHALLLEVLTDGGVGTLLTDDD